MLPLEFDCKETQDCTGKQIRFLYSEQDDIKSAQYKYDICYKYTLIIDSNIISTGKYNGLERKLRYKFLASFFLSKKKIP